MANRGQMNLDALESVEGWLLPSAVLLTQLLIQGQRARGEVTGVLELGVYRGKYLSLLAACVGDCDTIPVVGVDAFFEYFGMKLAPEHRADAERRIHEAIALVSGARTRATILEALTQEVDPQMLMQLAPKGYSFISIDAGPTSAERVVELEIAQAVLSENGIAAVAGVFSPTVPGRGEGTFAFFHGHPNADLAPFATGGNKVFFSRRSRHRFYYDACFAIAERAKEDYPLLGPTTALIARGRTDNVAACMLGYDIVPFVDDAFAAAYGLNRA